MAVDISEIRRALKNDEIVPYFQPMVDLAKGTINGFEVLARWQHPQQGLIPPNDFIPAIEEHGLATELMTCVMKSAFREALLFPKPFRISVNISPTQLRDLSLPEAVRRAGDTAGFPLDRLTIEITETAVLHDLKLAKAITRALKGIGCKISLDDFGTGYSSLSYLQALPFDEIKIDRSFVHSMTQAKESRKIVATIVGLGPSLGIVTVAEGIETENQALRLLQLGCELGQGWLYGRPVSIEAVHALLAADPAPFSFRNKRTHQDRLDSLPTLRLPQLQAIYDGAPVGLCFLDSKFRYVSLNQRLAQMNGASVSDHLGRTVQEMLPGAYANIEPYLVRAMQGLASPEVEIERASSIPGGEIETRLASYQPARDEANEVVGVSIASMDITDRKRIEAALRESEEIHQNMYQLHPQVPWIMDPEGLSLAVNSRWVEATGAETQKARSLMWINELHPKDKLAARQIMEMSIRTGTPIDMKYRVKNESGRWTWKRSRGAPRFGLRGEIIRWYGIVEDSTSPTFDRKAKSKAA